MLFRILAIVVIITALIPGALVNPAAGDTMLEPVTLIDFKDSDLSAWSVVNDGVMGGVSSSAVRPSGQGTGVFSGELSLENNGGFASIRRRVEARDLDRWTGLQIRVRGDGRTYQLRLRNDERFDGTAYRAEFATGENAWTTVSIAFDAFVPTFRGRILDDAPPLDPNAIASIAFMLADKRPGSFSLEIDHVRTWRSRTVAPSSAEVRTVESVDLDRYVGLWYEVAKIPNRFQKSCARGTSAEYTLRDDGRIDVVNRCYKPDGSLNEAKGLAEIQDRQSRSKLKVSFVSFFGWRPFWGDYWVIGLDPDYRWSIVGTPDRKYGWVLARTPGLDPETLETIFGIIEANGYDRGVFEISAP